MARVSHFEHMYADPAAAARFYEAALGWTTHVWEGGEQPYWLVTTGAPTPKRASMAASCTRWRGRPT